MKKLLKLPTLFLIMSMLFISMSSVAQMSILLVDDNAYDPTRISKLQIALSNNGYAYTDYTTSLEASSPTYAYMSTFDLVIWYTGNDGAGLYLWNSDDTDNQDIMDYIDNGGMFWLQGLDFLYDRYGIAPDTFVTSDFVYDYLGIEEYHAQSHVDDGIYSDGVPQFDVVPGNPIFSFTPMLWSYTTMWYADALMPTPLADSIYRMGPNGYDFDIYYGSVYLEKGTGKVLTINTETARIDTQSNTDLYFNEGLTYFEQFINSTILITDITVSGEEGATTIDVDNGTLQMYVDILPVDATNQTVTWSVIDGTATASIDDNGLLMATGTPAGNGTVYVKAVANDGSGIVDSLLVTISTQGSLSNFNVLLVNDNNNDIIRYEILETSLINLNYVYDVYNTILTEDFPNATTLSNYDAVIWYTGNDGADLYLWDTTDVNDYKFNAQLIQYVDAGGIVWLQGLDYMYDVFGLAPDTFIPGQFVYDYMGIEEYHAQSHVDDGTTGLEQMETIENNGIFTLTPVEWTYTEMWYADAFTLAEDARGLYMMGPETYILSDYYCGLYKYHNQGGLVMNFAIETARINNQVNTDEFINQGLNFFNVYLNTNIIVQSITVVGENDIDFIDENNGTLQLYVDVLPQYVPNNNVVWSVTDGTTSATINDSGLLQANGTLSGNGTIWAVATAADGSGIVDSLLITISNQGIPSDFSILLVNDNNYGSDRYMVIDTTLLNLGYNYDVYNTIETSDFPDFATLDYYDLVIWYTGNDGTELYLWDISDTTDFKFNEPLISYIDNGGYVWIQGLDFLYDIVGSAPVTFENGKFINNYMGIEQYFAQSYADDGELGLPQMDVVPNNGICTISPIEWTYPTLWYADAIAVTEGTNTIYQMGSSDYIFADYFTAFNRWVDEACVMTFTVETARINTRENTEELFFQVIEYLKLTTGVDEIVVENMEIEIYPNPTSNDITLRINNDAKFDNSFFELYDITGHKVINQKISFITDMEISLSNLQKGLYIYCISSGTNMITGKIVKQ